MSDASKGPAWGTIFTPQGEQTLGSLEHARSTAWNERDEAVYLARVCEKAGVMARNLLAEAKAEAEIIREQARKEGYDEGLAEAEAELESFRSGMAESVSAVLSAIEGQCSAIFSQWRGDLVGIARLAVERITALELEDKRAQTLEALLTEAVGLLEKRRELVIRVSPEDEPMIKDIVEQTKQRFEDVRSWRVKSDPAVSPGGMVAESESSLAEGRLESRKAAVDEILSRLTLPEYPEADQPEEAADETEGYDSAGSPSPVV